MCMLCRIIALINAAKNLPGDTESGGKSARRH